MASSRASAIPRTPMRMSLLVLHTPSIPGLPRERHRSQAPGDAVAHPGCASTTLSHPSLVWCSSHVSLPRQSTKNAYTDRYQWPSVDCCLGRLPGTTRNLEIACKRKKKKILFSNMWKEFLVTIVHLIISNPATISEHGLVAFPGASVSSISFFCCCLSFQ